MESRKRIVVNDESDDEGSVQQEHNAFTKFALPQQQTAQMDDGWLDTRDPSSMTMSEKQENITSARLERKDMATLTPKPQSMSLLSPGLEDTPENATKAQHSRLRRLEKANDHYEEVPPEQQKKPAKKKVRRSVEEADEESFDDSDVTEESDDDESIGDSSDADAGANIESDGEGQEYDDENEHERGQQELKDMAAKILKKCDKTIASLRDALRIWAGGSVSGVDKNGDADCVNLLSIEGETGDHRILKDKDFSVMCPSLELKPYQLVGVNWLKLLHQNGVNGVLADDMGLGKTVQTIAFLGWLRGRANRRTSLIVVPATTLSNWCNELEKFCPNLRVTVYHGSQKERDMMRYPLHTSIEAREVDVVLSTYTIFERESCKEDQSFLRKQRFDYVILDEAHCIKVQILLIVLKF
jgi:SNF2 family DNA or RNA helicase